MNDSDLRVKKLSVTPEALIGALSLDVVRIENAVPRGATVLDVRLNSHGGILEGNLVIEIFLEHPDFDPVSDDQEPPDLIPPTIRRID